MVPQADKRFEGASPALALRFWAAESVWWEAVEAVGAEEAGDAEMDDPAARVSTASAAFTASTA